MKIQSLKNQKKNKKGFALTEVLLAIAVIVIIGIAAYPLYKNARTSSEVEAMANDMAIIQTSSQTLYSGQSGYAGPPGISTAQLETAGMAPDDLKTSGAGPWQNSWGGTVTVLPTTATVAGLNAGSGFTIELTNVPTTACTQIVNRVAPSFLAIGAGSGSTVDNIKGGLSATDPTRVDVDALATACKAGAVVLDFTAR